MGLAVFLTLLGSFMWSCTNHIDKFLVSKTKGRNPVEALLIFSTLIAGLVSLPFTMIYSRMDFDTNLLSLVSIFFCINFNIVIIFLFWSTQKNDTTIVAAVFQMIPVFSFLISLLVFNEELVLTKL